ATVPVSGGSASPILPTRPDRRWLRPLGMLALLAVAAAVLSTVTWQREARHPAPTAAAIGVAAGPVRRVTFAAGSEDHPRLNAGGDWLVYTRRDRLGDAPGLFLQSLHGTEAITLAGGDHAERPAWSPDGREVAYVWRADDGTRCEIRITSIDGGGHQSISECPARSVVYLDWNPADADQIAYSAIIPGSAADTRVTLLRRTLGWAPEPFEYGDLQTAVDLYPRFSPDGTRIAFRGNTNPTSDLYWVGIG